MRMTKSGTSLLIAVNCTIALGATGAATAAGLTYTTRQLEESAIAPFVNRLKAEFFENKNPEDSIKAISPSYDGFFDKQYSEG